MAEIDRFLFLQHLFRELSIPSAVYTETTANNKAIGTFHADGFRVSAGLMATMILGPRGGFLWCDDFCSRCHNPLLQTGQVPNERKAHEEIPTIEQDVAFQHFPFLFD
ncbi:MAG: hypothetical protein ACE5MB_05900 [Anaerolineae bacterium]